MKLIKVKLQFSQTFLSPNDAAKMAADFYIPIESITYLENVESDKFIVHVTNEMLSKLPQNISQIVHQTDSSNPSLTL